MSTLTSWWSGEGSESGEVAATSSETPLLDAAASETAQTTAPVVEAPGRSHPLHAEDKVWADGFTMDDWRAAQAHQDDIMSRYNHLSVDGMELDTPYRINTVKAQTKQFGQAFGMEEQHSLLTGETEIPNYWSNPVLHAVAGKGSPEDIEKAIKNHGND